MQCVRYIVQIFGNLLILLYITHLQNSPGYFFEHTLQWLYKEKYNNIIFKKSWILKELTFLFNNNISRKNNNAYDDYGENHSNAYYQDL